MHLRIGSTIAVFAAVLGLAGSVVAPIYAVLSA
jgi:hypothetical protein